MARPSSPGARRVIGGTRTLLVGMVVTAVGATSIGVAAAHEVDPTVRTVLDEVDPAVDGLVVQVGVSVTTQLLVENRTGDVLEVLDDDGNPFLRIGPDTVEADVASPAWARSNSPGGTVPAGVRAGAPARWAQVATEPAWGWFDHRLHPEAIVAMDEDDRVAWEIPMRLGDEQVSARGHLERRKVLGGFTSRLVGSPEPFDGVVVQVLDGRSPGVFLRNTSAIPVVAIGGAGEPFARIGPHGVEVNRRSPLWLHSAQAEALPLDGLAADSGADPEWIALGPEPSLAWLDDRGRWPSDDPPEGVDADAATVVIEWAIPIEQAGQRREVRATTSWVPAGSSLAAAGEPADASDGGEGLPWWLVLAAVPVVLGSVTLVRGARSAPRTR